MKEEIKQWLAGPRDYDTGVRLYCRYGKNRHMKAYLQRKRNPLKLLYELSKLVGIDAFVAPAVSPPELKPKDSTIVPELKPNERLKIIREGGVSYNQLPKPLRRVYQEACEAYRQMRHLHEKMKLAATDPERAELRAELLTQADRNRACWAAIDRWAADRTLPEPPATETKEGPVDAKALNAARAGITRYLNQLDQTKDEKKRESYLDRLRSYVTIVKAAGCEFKNNTPRLQAIGLLP